MDEEEVTLTMGLGVLVRAAAALEYTLHGLLVDLDEAPRAYAYRAGATGSQLARHCIESLQAGKGSAITSASRDDMINDLELCRKQFDIRHRFIHGYLQRDDESQLWVTLKGSRARDARHPEIHFTTCSELWALAVLSRSVVYTADGWLAAECGVAAMVVVGVQ
ncbi:hypothetical protein ACFU6S_42530, partial [Streptomyces sp. NPDC057456]|uniref:hypothetical protein n=1 Tax=Streptomyces sp. NPDC057456 TaxID=3346139 RepID=UPI0036C6D3DD